MKIVLAEERNGNQLSEQSFDQAIVRIGRDANDCQILFDSTQFSMVSRRHAELHWRNGQWFLHDLNSTFGTFIDGQKITAPQPFNVGSKLQFGLEGPILRVVWFEMSVQTPPIPAANLFQNQPIQPAQKTPPNTPPPNIVSQTNQSTNRRTRISQRTFCINSI